MTYDASTPACAHCKNPHTGFSQAQLIFCEQKEMPMVGAIIYEDSSHKFEEIPGDAGDDANDPGLSVAMQFTCTRCGKPTIVETLLWSPWA